MQARPLRGAVPASGRGADTAPRNSSKWPGAAGGANAAASAAGVSWGSAPNSESTGWSCVSTGVIVTLARPAGQAPPAGGG